MKIEVKDFNLKDTILSGACFRVTEESDGSFTNILSDRVINIKQVSNNLIISSNNNENLKEIILEYFDLKRDYNFINKQITGVIIKDRFPVILPALFGGSLSGIPIILPFTCLHLSWLFTV